jgi:DNA gyrase subunit A
VKLIGLDDGAKLSGLQRIVENDANVQDESVDGAADAEGGDAAGSTDESGSAE